MDKYNEFIKESSDQQEAYVERLKYLVDMAFPLMDEVKRIYGDNSKWRRANEAKRKLNDSWGKIFNGGVNGYSLLNFNKQVVNKEDKFPLDIKYRYLPDRDCYGDYRRFMDKEVILVAVRNSSGIVRTNDKNFDKWYYASYPKYDSFDRGRCNYCILITEYGNPGPDHKIRVWTRPECLKQISK